MSIAEPRIGSIHQEPTERLRRLDLLMEIVSRWAEGAGWRTRRTTRRMTEPDLGRSEVPLLILERDEVEAVLGPVSGTGGAVDLYLMPAYDDVVRLIFEEGEWWIRPMNPPDPTSPRLDLATDRLLLNEPIMLRILDALSAHA